MEIKKAPISVYAEMTPNPVVMKFVANKRIIEGDSVEFKNVEEAKPSPLASKLFHLPFVKEVFISSNYLAIAKYDIIEWDEVTTEIRELITQYLQSGQPVLIEIPESEKKSNIADPSASTQAKNTYEVPDPKELGEIETRIVEILEEYVAPAVESDGGAIKFMGYEDGVVKVLLQGACSGCPSSTLTLQSGILNILQKMLPTLIKSVEPVNG
ncbi:MAG: NifU family protein [Cryomorphaceae bacterium]|nr:NifU family protein [Cryomorphaceae bacterium]